MSDRTSVTLSIVFLLTASFYLWTAATSIGLKLYGLQTNHYYVLANTFLHFHLSAGVAPVALESLPEPYSPGLNGEIQTIYGIHDYAFYNGHLYLTWGPTPALLIAPLVLIGIVPSTSLIAVTFAIVGLAFALATLRVILRAIGDVALWMVILAGLTLALAASVPFILRRPLVYEDAIAGGFCFAMAGIWLAFRALATRRASLGRLALLSLCFGLAVGARPTIGLTALVIVPVYLTLRATIPRRRLVIALVAPLGGCLLLLLLYNQARYGKILEVGTNYALAGINPRLAHLGSPSYLLPGLWTYLLSLPRITSLFPFLLLGPPPLSYPGHLPAGYNGPEISAGILLMSPIVLFAATLCRDWRGRSGSLGGLGFPLLLLAAGGMTTLLYVSFEFFSATERYEVDFSTPIVLAGVAAWLWLSHQAGGQMRRLIRFGGALLASWSCIAGLAISFVGYEDLLAAHHPGIWRNLQNLGSPISTAIVTLAGRPELGEISGAHVDLLTPTDYIDLEARTNRLWVAQKEKAVLTIISPGAQTATLILKADPETIVRTSLRPGGPALRLLVSGPGASRSTMSVPEGGRLLYVHLHLNAGLNRIALTPLASNTTAGSGVPVLMVTQLALDDS